MNRLILLIILLAAITLVSAGPVQAHRIKIFATQEGKTITGYAYVPGGKRISGASITLKSAHGEAISQKITNQMGEFAFKDVVKGQYDLSVDLGDGHGAKFAIGVNQQEDIQAGISNTNSDHGQADIGLKHSELKEIIDMAITRQLRPLKEQLAEYEDHIRFSDVIGGLGYILGLAGLAVLLMNRKRSDTRKMQG